MIPADEHSAYCACISPDDRSIATGGSEFAIRIWNADNGALRVGNANTNGPVKALAYSTDRKMLVAGLLDRLRFNEPNAFPIAAFITFRMGEVLSIATSADGRYLAAADSSGIVISHRGDWFVSSGTDGFVKTWHLRPGSR